MNLQPETHRLIARIGLALTAFILWRAGIQLQIDGYVALRGTLVALLAAQMLAGLVLLAVALTHREPERFAYCIPVALAVSFVGQAYSDYVAKDLNQPLPTTDAHVFVDYSARLLLKKRNPYTESMLPAFGSYRLPYAFSTPLTNGDISVRQAYPALSFLLLVPFIVAGIPSTFVFQLFFAASLVLVYLMARPKWRPVALLPFFVDRSFLSYTFGGVTDSVWMFALILVVANWRHPVARAALFGLACAYKQQPWLIAPFALIRIWLESEPSQRIRETTRFTYISVGVFVVINLPFIFWGPSAWFHGIFEPLVASMVPLGEGLSGLTMNGYLAMPRWAYSAIWLSVWALMLFAYVRQFRTLRDLMWLAPAFSMWFSFRSLTTYWYFNVAPLLLAHIHVARAPAPKVRAVRPTLEGYGIATVGAIVATFVAVFSLRGPAFAGRITGPMTTWNRNIVRMNVHVRNLLNESVEPRFLLQAGNLQPLQWQNLAGPGVLQVGQEADYTIASIEPLSEPDFSKGGRLIITDRGSPAFRIAIETPRVVSLRQSATFPNPNFEAWDERAVAPTGYQIVRSGKLASSAHLTRKNEQPGQVELVVDPVPALPTPRFMNANTTQCFSGTISPCNSRIWSEADGRSFVGLETELEPPSGKLNLVVSAPDHANENLESGTLFGMRFVVDDAAYVVLLGGHLNRGKLADGTPFTTIPLQNHTAKLDIYQQLLELRAPLERSLIRIWHLPEFEPTKPVIIVQFFIASTTQATAVVQHIDDVESAQSVETALARDARYPWLLERLHGVRETRIGNWKEARAHFEVVAAQQPSDGANFDLALAALFSGAPERAAALYAETASHHYRESRSLAGLGVAQLLTGQCPASLVTLERSLVLFRDESALERLQGETMALESLANAHAACGTCARAHEIMRKLEQLDAVVPKIECIGEGK